MLYVEVDGEKQPDMEMNLMAGPRLEQIKLQQALETDFCIDRHYVCGHWVSIATWSFSEKWPLLIILSIQIVVVTLTKYLWKMSVFSRKLDGLSIFIYRHIKEEMDKMFIHK